MIKEFLLIFMCDNYMVIILHVNLFFSCVYYIV